MSEFVRLKNSGLIVHRSCLDAHNETIASGMDRAVQCLDPKCAWHDRTELARREEGPRNDALRPIVRELFERTAYPHPLSSGENIKLSINLIGQFTSQLTWQFPTLC